MTDGSCSFPSVYSFRFIEISFFFLLLHICICPCSWKYMMSGIGVIMFTSGFNVTQCQYASSYKIHVAVFLCKVSFNLLSSLLLIIFSGGTVHESVCQHATSGPPFVSSPCCGLISSAIPAELLCCNCQNPPSFGFVGASL